MTKYERLNTLLSIIALLAAVASPFIAYRWLDPQLQSFKNRARLEVSEIKETWESTAKPQGKAEAKLGTKPKTKAEIKRLRLSQFLEYLFDVQTFQMQILNVGNLPAREVSIVLQYGAPPTNPFVEITPPLLMESSDRDNLKFVTLKQPIAPNDAVKVKLRPAPDQIWVSNEFGERNNLITKAELTRIINQSFSLNEYRELPKEPTKEP